MCANYVNIVSFRAHFLNCSVNENRFCTFYLIMVLSSKFKILAGN